MFGTKTVHCSAFNVNNHAQSLRVGGRETIRCINAFALGTTVI